MASFLIPLLVARNIRIGDAALVVMVPMKPVYLEIFPDYPGLGRFSARDNKLVFVGVIKAVSYNPVPYEHLSGRNLRH